MQSTSTQTGKSSANRAATVNANGSTKPTLQPGRVKSSS